MTPPSTLAPDTLRALRLRERAALLAKLARPARLAPTASAESAARSRHERAWREQPPFDRPGRFDARLALEGFTREDFAAVCAAPPEALLEALPEAPSWAREIDAAYDAAATEPPPPPRLDPPLPLDELLAPFAPLVARFRARLREGIERVAEREGAPGLDVVAIEAAAAARIARRLIWMSAPTIVLELHAAKLLDQLAGDTPERRFEGFIATLANPERAREWLAEYPVLARAVVEHLEQGCAATLEVLERLSADRDAIRTTFFAGRDPGALIELGTDSGDPHAGGRSVALLRFASGAHLAYKPRSLGVDAHFQRLLEWLNARGIARPFRALAVLDRGTHGWMEFVEPADCASPAEVGRCFERLGALLAVLDTLRGVDLHYENLIAAGEHPIVVDLETLFHPTPPWSIDRPARERAVAAALDDSVLRVGLLPYQLLGDADGEPDLSGLGAAAGGPAPDAVVQWENVGRDDMRATRATLPLPEGRHRPRLGGSPSDPSAHTAAIAASYRDTLALLARHRDALLGTGGPLRAFAGDRVRVLLRPTRAYGLLLDEGWHPDLMRDALDRDRFFERLWVASESPHQQRAIPAEVADLWNADVPCFFGRPDSRDLFTSRGEALRDFFAEPPFAEVERRLRALDDSFAARQAWLVRVTLGMEILNRDQGAWLEYPLARRAAPPDPARLRERALAESARLGEWFERMAVGDRDRATWITLDFRSMRWTVSPGATDLYSGTLGIALFLARLGAIAGDARASALARRGLTAFLERVDRVEHGTSGPGLFQGFGGALFALAHLASLWDDRTLLAEAEARLDALAATLDDDRDFDIVGGAAGAIVGLHALARAGGDARALDFARRCGEHLLRHASAELDGLVWRPRIMGGEPGAGFAHGASGIACALLQLAEWSGEPRFADAARAALRAEEHLLRDAIERWDADAAGGPGAPSAAPNPPAPALESSGVERTISMSWCYGIPGLGLARLIASRSLGDESLRAEALALAQRVVARGFGKNHCLCHGDLGNLDLLLLAAREWNDEPLAREAARWAEADLDAIRSAGWRCGTMSGVEAPGLMNGLAGIGYGLLRVAAPELVPSVLALEPPRGAASS